MQSFFKRSHISCRTSNKGRVTIAAFTDRLRSDSAFVCPRVRADLITAGNNLYLNCPSLEAFRASHNTDKYETVRSMLTFELNNGTADSGRRNASGCRTLLRLQRALEFILQFMGEIAQSDHDAKISTIASKVYHDTLAKHHPWLTRKMA